MSEYWRVNSYGYPNPMSDLANARQAWETLMSFVNHQSYSELKRYWASGHAPRIINAHTVESWKAAFEEVGLLYVLSGHDDIVITPAGSQFIDAAQAGREQDLAWIGINLLLRYPLRGPRRSRGPRYDDSDLLLYWFLYAAIRELGNYFWWTELERVLCKVFLCSEATPAIETIRRLRDFQIEPESLPLPVEETRGAFYNSLNQVIVHASMNYLTIGKGTDDRHYDSTRTERRHWIKPEWLPLIDLAMGGQLAPADCGPDSSVIDRMPRAPRFNGDEEEYFHYVGSLVPNIADTTNSGSLQTPIRELPFGAGTVSVLDPTAHYRVSSQTSISGPLTVLCRLSRGQRLVLLHDLAWTYIIEDKQRAATGDIVITVRRARPITDRSQFDALIEGTNA